MRFTVRIPASFFADHLYAVVASSHSKKFRPHSIVTFSRDGSVTPSSLSRHSSLSILDQVRPPNLLDLIPPPPAEEPPVCLVADLNTWFCPANSVCCGSNCHLHHPMLQPSPQQQQQQHGVENFTNFSACVENVADVATKNQSKPRVRYAVA